MDVCCSVLGVVDERRHRGALAQDRQVARPPCSSPPVVSRETAAAEAVDGRAALHHPQQDRSHCRQMSPLTSLHRLSPQPTHCIDREHILLNGQLAVALSPRLRDKCWNFCWWSVCSSFRAPSLLVGLLGMRGVCYYYSNV